LQREMFRLVDETGHVFVCDFGFTRLEDATGGGQSNPGGTMVYLAPELLDPPQFGLANWGFERTECSDVYTCGMLFLEASPDAIICSLVTNHIAGSHS
jgi:serine/threonine protein kinase